MKSSTGGELFKETTADRRSGCRRTVQTLYCRRPASFPGSFGAVAAERDGYNNRCSGTRPCAALSSSIGPLGKPPGPRLTFLFPSQNHSDSNTFTFLPAATTPIVC
ncbi:hypothetical protein EYF80_058550 [Liparis tanakae]|uniref:Uncharacterized protein n=1 Tax=Liparis tanakae TaxID=230148 RepID=A0A4Z2ER74_9TELE|nr:hypothetical protein EYF80_058550 [Liparis tanakae]